MKNSLNFFLCFCFAFIPTILPGQPEVEQGDFWSSLGSGGHFVLMRHALAPGTGDPANFALGRRETQRNLSPGGREQAGRIGDLFRARGIGKAQVYSSEWYRCRDTARLLNLGPVTPLPALNSFFGEYDKKDKTMQSLRAWLSRQKMNKPMVLVTHQVNITALTGVFPSSGDLIFVKKNPQEKFQVVGRMKTD